jgi:hypothetical protein
MSKGIHCANHGWNAHVYHDSIDAVRECFAARQDFDDQAKAEPHRTASFGLATDQALADEEFWGEQMQAKERAEDERVAAYKQARDQELTAHWPEDPTVALNAQAKARTYGTSENDWQPTRLHLDHVPDASYAIEHPEDGKLRFLEVEHGEAGGQYADWQFVSVRASDEWHKLGKVNPKYGTYGGKAVALVGALASMTAEQLLKAAARYGQELGECGYCHRTLTDEDSRRLGYGKICAGHHGLQYP